MSTKQSTASPLKPRYIRLSDDDWALFRGVGGVEWLREKLAKLDTAAINRHKRAVKIRKDAADGMSDLALSKKYNLDRVTIWRIRK